MLSATLADLKEAVDTGTPFDMDTLPDKDEWLSQRRKRISQNAETKLREVGEALDLLSESESSLVLAARQSSLDAMVVDALADVPVEVPALPSEDVLVVPEIFGELKERVLAAAAVAFEPEDSTAPKESRPIAVVGMGGMGKSTAATALIRDHDIRTAFDRMYALRHAPTCTHTPARFTHLFSQVLGERRADARRHRPSARTAHTARWLSAA